MHSTNRLWKESTTLWPQRMHANGQQFVNLNGNTILMTVSIIWNSQSLVIRSLEGIILSGVHIILIGSQTGAEVRVTLSRSWKSTFSMWCRMFQNLQMMIARHYLPGMSSMKPLKTGHQAPCTNQMSGTITSLIMLRKHSNLLMKQTHLPWLFTMITISSAKQSQIRLSQWWKICRRKT